MNMALLIDSLNDVSRLLLRNKLDVNKIDFVEIFRVFYDKLNELGGKRQLKFCLARALTGLFKALQAHLESSIDLVLALLLLQVSAISRLDASKTATKPNLLVQLDLYFNLLLDTLRRVTKESGLCSKALFSLGHHVFELLCLVPNFKESPVFFNGCIELLLHAMTLCQTSGLRLPNFLLYLAEFAVVGPVSECLVEQRTRNTFLYIASHGIASLLESENLLLLAQQSDCFMGHPRLCEKVAECALALVSGLNQFEGPAETATATTLAARILTLLHRRIGEAQDDGARALVAEAQQFVFQARSATHSQKEFEAFANREFYDQRLAVDQPPDSRDSVERRNPLVYYFVDRRFGGTLMTNLIGSEKISGQYFFESYFALAEAKGISLLSTLRRFCLAFQLKAESQVLERVMMRLARKVEKEVGIDHDSGFAFFCALLMINTDLHNKEVRDKMTQDQFRKNVKMILSHGELSDEMIDQFYREVKEREVRFFDFDRLRAFSAEEFCEYAALVERARDKFSRLFYPADLSGRLTEAERRDPSFALRFVSTPLEARFLAALPLLVQSCVRSPDALELLVAFCVAPAAHAFDEKLAAELENVVLAPTAFNGPDGLFLVCAHARLLSALSAKTPRLASLFISFIVAIFPLLMFAFDDPIVKAFLEKYDAILRAQRKQVGGKSAVSFLKSLVSEDSSEDEAEALARANILQRSYKPTDPPAARLLQLRPDPPHLLGLVGAAADASARASPAASRALVFVLYFLTELAKSPRLKSILPALLAAVEAAAVRTLGPAPVKRKKALFWSESLDFLRAMLKVRLALSGTRQPTELRELLTKMAPETLALFLSDTQAAIEQPEVDPHAARDIAELCFEELLRREPAKANALAARMQALLARVAIVLMADSPDEALFFLFELFDKSLTTEVKFNSIGLLLVPLTTEPDRPTLSNRLLVLLAEKIFSTIATENLRIALGELPLLVFSLAHRLDLATLEPDKAAFLAAELLAAENALRGKIGDSPLLTSSLLLILSRTAARLSANSLLAVIKPAVSSCIRLLKSQEDSANFPEMEAQFADFVRGAGRSEEARPVMRDALARFGENFSKRFLDLLQAN